MTAKSAKTAAAAPSWSPPPAVFTASQRMRRGKVPGKDADAVETTLLCSRSLAIELHVIAAGIDYVWLADSDYSVSWQNGPVAYHHLLPWGAPARCVSLYL